MRSPLCPLSLLLSLVLLPLLLAPPCASALRIVNVTNTGVVSQSAPSWAVIDSQLVTNVSQLGSVTIQFVQGAHVQPDAESQHVAFFADSQPMPTGAQVTCEQVLESAILIARLAALATPQRLSIEGIRPRRWTVVVTNCPNHALTVESWTLTWTGVIDSSDDCIPGLTCAGERRASVGTAVATVALLALAAAASSWA